MTADELSTLPTRLTTPVLVDAIFELKFNGGSGIADLLPGALAAGLAATQGAPQVSRLAAAEIPLQIRMSQPELLYAPVVQLRWGEYMVNIGDRALAIACTLPYVGWKKFNKNINTIISQLTTTGLIKNVEQFGFKYVDFLSDELFAGEIERLDWKFSLGQQELKAVRTQLRTEWYEEDAELSVEIVGAKNMTVEGKPQGSGIVIGTGAANLLSPPISWERFQQNLEQDLERLHFLAKKTFFRCLTRDALDILKPVYEESKNA